MAMTKKDYEQIAAVIKEQYESASALIHDERLPHETRNGWTCRAAALDDIAKRLSDLFGEQNEKFRPFQFEVACGIAARLNV